jgi:hypothetical protein
MRAILINPFEREITTVIRSDDYKDIYTYLSRPDFDVNTFTVVHLDEFNDIFIDDEGLYVEDQAFFSIAGTHSELVLAGMGLVLGHDGQGESTSSDLLIEEVRAAVTWKEPADRPEIKFEISGF